MVSPLKLCILTEGGQEAGFGHIARCTSFYDALFERGHDVQFIIHGDESISVMLSERKFKLIDWHGNVKSINNFLLDFDVVILDSLYLDQSEIDFLCFQRFLLVSIDDFLRNLYHNTIIIDWTVNVEKSQLHSKNTGNNNILLLGIEYLVLRKPFWSNSNRKISDLRNILITIGGSDIRELTLPLINHLSARFKDLKFHVIVGSASVKKKILPQSGSDHIIIYESVNSERMKSVMDICDVAISAGGQTLYELASVGMPTIAIEIIDNQREDIMGWKSKGLLYKVFEWNDLHLLDNISQSLTELYSENIRKNIYDKINNLIQGDAIYKIVNMIETRSNDKGRE